MNQHKPSKKKWWENIYNAVVAFMIFAAALVTVLYYLNIRPHINGQSLQLTVYVHGQYGKQHIVLENIGKLIVDFDNDRRTAMIGESGRTNFGEIPEKFNNQKIGVGLESSRIRINRSW